MLRDQMVHPDHRAEYAHEHRALRQRIPDYTGRYSLASETASYRKGGAQPDPEADGIRPGRLRHRGRACGQAPLSPARKV